MLALDISPVYSDKKIIVGDWIKNNTFYSNILGDGVLNFNEELCHALLDMAEKNSSQFLVRAFNHRLDIMKVANYFPSVNSFKIKPKVIYSSDIYNFYKWNFNHHA